MPKKTELHNILLLGSGPIVIGQACEFDYAGVQACKALRAAGCRVILVNPNPASIMTDIDIADATYLEPINWQSVAKIIEKERPDALLPIMGGQTALNCTLDLIRHGILSKFSVEMIGVTEMTIRKAEDRQLFVESMRKIGLSTPKSQLIHTLPQVEEISTHFNFPVFMRTSFTLGGTGCGIAHSVEEMLGFCQHAFQLSPETGILVEEALLGWKEYELEVMRDNHDNCIVVCSIENLDPIGIHTGDSATVAPAQTLTDKEYQQLRNAAFSIMREVGITSGGCNIQFAVHPVDGRVMVIEMNPRVSRSSALASKATGYPIAKVATQLALGYTLAELQSEIIGSNIPASFEPALDYIVTKLPRFNMEKFPQANHQLNAQMRSIGEVMAVGRTFQESLQKALCSLENDAIGFTFKIKSPLIPTDCEILREYLRHPTPYRLWHIAAAFRENMSVNEVHELTQIDPWFLVQIQQLIQEEERLIQDTKDPNSVLDMVKLRQLKRKGFSDARIAELLGLTEQFIRDERMRLGIQPVYKRIDSCAAEFPSNTNFFYSTYEDECEAERNTNKKILIIGSGPNRIGQGIEFDYCCVHAIFALKAAGYETVLVNCNPETVSTDYDVADRLYFEPLTLEHILSVIECEKPMGVLVQYGGQAPLKLATALELAGVKLLGTSVEAIERTEDRSRCQTLFKMLRLNQPKNLVVHNQAEVQQLAKTIRYPVVVRPSYVLGGETMRIAFDKKQLIETTEKALAVSHSAPVLLESFLEDSIEVEIDAICDGEVVYVPGIIEHLERAGIHSGD